MAAQPRGRLFRVGKFPLRWRPSGPRSRRGGACRGGCEHRLAHNQRAVQVSDPARERVLAAVNELAYRPPCQRAALATSSPPARSARSSRSSRTPRRSSASSACSPRWRETPFDLVVCDVADARATRRLLGRRAPIEGPDGLLIISLAPLDDEAEGLTPRMPGGAASTRRIRGCHAWSPTMRMAENWRRGTCSSSATSASRSSATTTIRATGSWQAGCAATAIAARSTEPVFQCGANWSEPAHTAAACRPADQRAARAAGAADSDLRGLRHAGAGRARGSGRRRGRTCPATCRSSGSTVLAVAAYVGLTAVAQPLFESGRRGLERLLALVEGDEPGPLEEQLELQLEVRRTTTPPR